MFTYLVFLVENFSREVNGNKKKTTTLGSLNPVHQLLIHGELSFYLYNSVLLMDSGIYFNTKIDYNVSMAVNMKQVS